MAILRQLLSHESSSEEDHSGSRSWESLEEENDWLEYEVYYAWCAWLTTFIIMLAVVIGLAIALVCTCCKLRKARRTTVNALPQPAVSHSPLPTKTGFEERVQSPPPGYQQ